ncbi:MAG: ribosome recycling factor [Caldiserica bacterium]|nr:ribosome recycling factor [Caldisericota bacterium]
MIKEILKKTEEKMQKCVSNLKHEFAAIRTGRATPALLDTVKVNYYGTLTPLKQVASITVPQANLLLVRVWDKTVVKEIEKAILKEDLGLMPQVEGETIRIPIPPLSEERREELVKIVRRIAEEGRVSIRAHRRHTREQIEEMKKKGEIPEDDAFRAEKDLQKLTDTYIEEVDKILQMKEKEIREE